MTRAKSHERRAKSQKCSDALRWRSGSPLSTLHSQLSRSGVTLVELLITILIISILAGLILGVAAVAGETAREAHSRNLITRLHTLLTEHYDSYKTRRVRLNPAVELAINSSGLRPAEKGKALAEARLYALREMMLMEIPDRWSDVLLTTVPNTNAGNAMPKFPIYLDSSFATATYGRTQLASVYLRRYFQFAKNARTADEVLRLTDNQGAECLYLVITLACGEGEARTLFHESDIGDIDSDGAPEFLDGWGRPINFLRWAPGFDSQIQLNANVLESAAPADRSAAIVEDHDPFDIFRAEAIAFRLAPLIFSAGSDETFGIRLVKPHVAWLPQTTPAAGLMTGGFPRLSPYWEVADPDDGSLDFLGTPNADGTSTDNIHNHLLGLR